MTPAAPPVHPPSPSSYPPSSTWSSRFPLSSASLLRHEVGVPASDSQSYLQSHRSLDNTAEMVVTAMVSNVVRMIGTRAGLSVQTAATKVQWCVSRSMFFDKWPTFSHHFLLSISIDQLDKTDAPLIPEAYINILGMQYPVSFFNGLTGYTVPLQHPRVQKITQGLKPSPCVHWTSAGRATNSARDAEHSWGPSPSSLPRASPTPFSVTT